MPCVVCWRTRSRADLAMLESPARPREEESDDQPKREMVGVTGFEPATPTSRT